VSEPDVAGSLRRRAEEAVAQWCEQSEVEYEPGARDGEFVLQLPGEAKLRTTVSVLVGERGLNVTAFVVRRPDENQEAFYRWMLTRNVRLPGIAFATDPLGDVYLVGRLPLAGVNQDTLDELLGAVLTASDGSFNDLLAIGFLSSMKREWAWRNERGESTRNLEAFRHLLEPSSSSAPEPQ
jgi:putative sensory transduction regulator